MSFAEWIFLIGALAAAGPVIAHLLAKPRYRRQPFTMLRFLQSGQVESQSRRRLRDLLMLILRCTIIILIAVLFARPALHISPKVRATGRIYYLCLDNSLSMAYSDESGSYLGRLKDSAVDYIRAADAEAAFNIFAAASGNWTHGLSKEQALAAVTELKIAPGSAKLSSFLSGVNHSSRTGRQDTAVCVLVVSDFTSSMLRQFAEILEPTVVQNTDYEVIASDMPLNNAAVIDAQAVGIVDGELTLNVTVANCGFIEQNRRLTAQAGAIKSRPVDVNLRANQRSVYQLRIDARQARQGQSFLPVELSLSGTDGLREDDTFYLAVSIPAQRNINVLFAEKGPDETFLLGTAVDTLSYMNSHDTFRTKRILAGRAVSEHLNWADVVICSGIADSLGGIARDMRSFVQAGGKVIFFVTNEPESKAAALLWREGILAALPGRFIEEPTYIEARPCYSEDPGVDVDAGKALSNYKIERVPLKGYAECSGHPKSTCLWRFKNGEGFIYLRRLGNGVSILVNTSIDDSLGGLTKSSASVAFCRYLLGPNNQIGNYSFACDDQVVLPLGDMRTALGGQKHVWVRTCDGKKMRAPLAGPSLLVPEPGGIGWVKTLGSDAMYAGINPPRDETDMTGPAAEEIANAMNRVFSPHTAERTALAQASGIKKNKPIWRLCAWVIIVLLLAEPAVANRLKR